MPEVDKSLGLVRIGVFYDGNYFLKVSDYYAYIHDRHSRLSLAGLHEFIRNQVAHEIGLDNNLCQIVDAHYFRGRLSAREASSSGKRMFNERVFDDILMGEGVTSHYLPLKNISGKKEEKGIDVWLALEAFELAIYKRFNVLALIACDGDYVPLVRKLNTLGTRVMLLSWDFEYTDTNGDERVTRTSQDLLEEVTYPLAMHEIINNRVKKNEPLIDNLFVKKSSLKISKRDEASEEYRTSEICVMKKGYGFIKYPPNNLFFHYTSIDGIDFNDLKVGDSVKFRIEKNPEGKSVAVDVSLVNN